jgi:hypothetical protein
MITRIDKTYAVAHIVELADRMAGSASKMSVQSYDELMSSRDELKKFTKNLVDQVYQVSMGD